MESGMRLTNVCVQHENKVCVRSLAYVCAAGGSKVTSSSGDVFH